MTVDRPLGRAVFLAALAILAMVTCRDHREATAPRSSGPADPKPSVATPTSDVATDVPPSILVGAGDIASCTTENDEATAKLLDGIAGTVVTLGDNAYEKGSAAEYANCYGPTWGRHKERTRPAAGERDYDTKGAAGYSGYFGAAAGEVGKFYYSYDLGDWHVVVLNTKLSSSQTAAMLDWLKGDLKANTKSCTIAYWHKPYVSSAQGRDSDQKPLWDLLHAFGAEVVLNAHTRHYERFAPQDVNEVTDAAYGIRQFMVGTGGAGTSAAPSKRRPASEVLNSGTPGVLKVTLREGAYDWEFVPIAGKTFTDAGTGTCHGFPPPVANPGGPYTSEATVAFKGSSSADFRDDGSSTYAWDFGDGSTSGEANPTHTYAADGVYTVTLVVTDSKGTVSQPATTTATIGNLPPSVKLYDRTAALGTTIDAKLEISDPGGATDGPWSYTINWGNGTSTTGIANEQGTITVDYIYPELGKYLAVATVTDKDGGSASDRGDMTVVRPKGGRVVLAAGDIADCLAHNRDELTAQILDQQVAAHPTATVLTLGDNAYPDGRLEDYMNCYGPTWGRHKLYPDGRIRTYAALGNHDYFDDADTPKNADGSFAYFGAAVGQAGTQPSCVPDPAIGRTCEGYFSIGIADWHIVFLNDEILKGASSPQTKWLVEDLAANTKKCQLAVWHRPRFLSAKEGGVTVRTTWKPWWDRLYAAGADIVLNAHEHFYERHHPLNPDGVRDDATGIRQFMVGTGGESMVLQSFLVSISPTSAVRGDHYGVLKLTLYPNAYEWQFIPAAGYTFTDSGSGVCH